MVQRFKGHSTGNGGIPYYRNVLPGFVVIHCAAMAMPNAAEIAVLL